MSYTWEDDFEPEDEFGAQGRRFMTNMSITKRKAIERAISETGYGIVICDKATDCIGTVMPDSFAVFCGENRDLGDFWRLVDKYEGGSK